MHLFQYFEAAAGVESLVLKYFGVERRGSESTDVGDDWDSESINEPVSPCTTPTVHQQLTHPKRSQRLTNVTPAWKEAVDVAPWAASEYSHTADNSSPVATQSRQESDCEAIHSTSEDSDAVLRSKETPRAEEASVVEEAPRAVEALVVEEESRVEEDPAVEEESHVEEASPVEEASRIEEASVVVEVTHGYEAPVVVEVTHTEEAPVVVEVTHVDNDREFAGEDVFATVQAESTGNEDDVSKLSSLADEGIHGEENDRA
eukprot:GEMP01021978.1.p1 GENE.GEMP01021978.1~~GEMP01021978.1.p1  ORF type:complete len:260 (+),score=94.36 GEMP01021978.1:80-859(+)